MSDRPIGTLPQGRTFPLGATGYRLRPVQDPRPYGLLPGAFEKAYIVCKPLGGIQRREYCPPLPCPAEANGPCPLRAEREGGPSGARPGVPPARSFRVNPARQGLLFGSEEEG